jgi:hypothetical protein
MIATIRLGVAFLLEIAVLVAIGNWGFSLTQGEVVRLVAGLGGPLVMAVLWGVFAAPKATIPLEGVADTAFRIAWFGLGAAAFWAAGLPIAAMALAAIYAVNALMPETL